MPFIVDLLKVAGPITAPILILSGVGAPLGIAIGAVSTAVTISAANEIEKHEENKKNDQAAAEAKQKAKEKIDEQARQETKRRKEIESKLEKQKNQANLAVRAVNACRNSNTAELIVILKDLSNEKFEELGLSLLAECPTAEARETVSRMIQNEQNRRYS